MRDLMLGLILSVMMITGCGPLEDCLDGCEDTYDDCVESGRSEGGCKSGRVACERACEDEELKNERDGETSGMDNQPSTSIVR